MAHPRHTRVLDDLRARIARVERSGRASRAVLPFGLPALDRHLPEGGLALGALHEVAPSGPELTHAAAASLFVGGILGRLKGPVLWCVGRKDLFAPALAGVGLAPGRLIFVETHGDDASVLAVLEEALRHPALAGVAGEVGRLAPTPARRLQIAAGASGVVAFALPRAATTEPDAAVTRWRVSTLPSTPLPVPGVGRPRWQLELARCRNGQTASWTMEGCDAKGRLGLAADMADGSAAARRPGRAAAG